MSFQQSKLWNQSFENLPNVNNLNERNYLKHVYLRMREKVSHLVSQIRIDMPYLTVHDVSHLDSLWEMADFFIDENFKLNTTEAFIFGASILLHDAGLCIAAYDNRLLELKELPEFKDNLAYQVKNDPKWGSINLENPPEELVRKVIPIVLRQKHADTAYKLATNGLLTIDKNRVFLIDEPEIQETYADVIGKIAQSHGYSASKLVENFPVNIGPHTVLNIGGSSISTSIVDGFKIACLLRLSDAIHIDSRRAPPFLRSLIRLEPNSDVHWDYQGKMTKPQDSGNSIIFTNGKQFKMNESKAWWLAHDTLIAIDQEIQDVNSILSEKYGFSLKIENVMGISSPKILKKYIKTKDWDPVDIKLHVSNAVSLVERFGGQELYGNSQTVPIRELIQNATDAVLARQKVDSNYDWGSITVGLSRTNNHLYLIIEDNGVGMSERVLTGALLDFGNSFWKSPEVMSEFPSLLSSEFNSIGKF